MRVTALSLIVMCALAVPADAPSLLVRAVELMRSDDPAQRELGSRLAHAEIGKFLKPLYVAMDDPDPEVRRLARSALEGRLPDRRAQLRIPSWHPLKACGAPDANANRDDPNAWASTATASSTFATGKPIRIRR